MPRNLSTMCYEEFYNLADKQRLLKDLLIIHKGEVREIDGKWETIRTPLPESNAWYHVQHRLEGGGHQDVNTFLRWGGHWGEHEQRRSRAITLAALFEQFRHEFTAETLCEFFITN